MIQTINTYQIEVCGEVDIHTINANSPLQIKVVRTDPDATIFEVSTDQSGLIGLIRHLHGQGFVLLSVHRQTDETIINKKKPNHE
jgi:hypothetical protein